MICIILWLSYSSNGLVNHQPDFFYVHIFGFITWTSVDFSANIISTLSGFIFKKIWRHKRKGTQIGTKCNSSIFMPFRNIKMWGIRNIFLSDLFPMTEIGQNSWSDQPGALCAGKALYLGWHVDLEPLDGWFFMGSADCWWWKLGGTKMVNSKKSDLNFFFPLVGGELLALHFWTPFFRATLLCEAAFCWPKPPVFADGGCHQTIWRFRSRTFFLTKDVTSHELTGGLLNHCVQLGVTSFCLTWTNYSWPHGA